MKGKIFEFTGNLRARANPSFPVFMLTFSPGRFLLWLSIGPSLTSRVLSETFF